MFTKMYIIRSVSVQYHHHGWCGLLVATGPTGAPSSPNPQLQSRSLKALLQGRWVGSSRMIARFQGLRRNIERPTSISMSTLITLISPTRPICAHAQSLREHSIHMCINVALVTTNRYGYGRLMLRETTLRQCFSDSLLEQNIILLGLTGPPVPI